MKTKKIIYICMVWFLVFNLVGCDAFVRKFTRKPKRDKMPAEEMVLAPEEYKGPGLSNEELYRQYLLFWKSWMGELIEALSPTGGNYKKQVKCCDEAIKNAEAMKKLLKPPGQKKIDKHLVDLNELKSYIVQDMYNSNTSFNRNKTERIRRDMLRDLSFAKIKNDLI